MEWCAEPEHLVSQKGLRRASPGRELELRTPTVAGQPRRRRATGLDGSTYNLGLRVARVPAGTPVEAEWQPLFNGKDLDGWEVDGDKQGWTVKDGAIATVPGVPSTWLAVHPEGLRRLRAAL